MLGLLGSFAGQHIVLEGARGVAQAKRHHRIVKQSIATSEGGLLFLSCSNSKLVIPILDVDLGEVLSTLDSVEQLSNKG